MSLFITLGNYTITISQEIELSHRRLAASILQEMRLSEVDKTNRLIEATVYYLDQLDDILDKRAVTLNGIEKNYKDDPKEKDSQIVKAYEIARDKYLPLKRMYVDKLENDLTPYQVERVKDGLTYDAFPNFHHMYLEMVPGLKPGEKAHILALLVEGRENAMLAVNKEGQTQWWDKYRGIINNYIASQGYDFGKLSKTWDKANADKEWAN
ncbi:DUF3826 domain-containing protein [Autumnicola musiva]|uniref:DUF3826 domain-containing protein n=1 Tax=Autumnicola musiva TaxID=3075589 RepID=A0ABU3D7Z7_9FLAO|nr:DUF3826 domain-containing protein [Zunongwangia sp. F117]MDT0677571.1 DUF3826 domain-containing protein [Zunongwangia sp. F117]